jgi:hypothetical protein
MIDHCGVCRSSQGLDSSTLCEFCSKSPKEILEECVSYLISLNDEQNAECISEYQDLLRDLDSLTPEQLESHLNELSDKYELVIIARYSCINNDFWRKFSRPLIRLRTRIIRECPNAASPV